MKLTNFTSSIDILKNQLQIKSQAHLDKIHIYDCISKIKEVDSTQMFNKTYIHIVNKFPNDTQSSDVLIDECIYIEKLMK